MILLLALLVAQVGAAGPIKVDPHGLAESQEGTVCQGSVPGVCGSGATLRTIESKERDMVSVCDFEQPCPSLTDDTAALQAAITALGASGGVVYLPPGTYLISTGLVTGSRVVHLLGGAGTGLSVDVGSTAAPTVIKGTAITLYTIQSSGSTIRDVQFRESSAGGSASTIGVDINNGVTGVNNWTLQNVSILSSASSKLGIGLRTVFALKGEVRGGNIEGWATGYRATDSGGARSNSNLFSAVKIRKNTTGVDFPSGGIDDQTFVGCTIEGNSTGISLAATTTTHLTLLGNHFENDGGGTPTNISASTGGIYSVSNWFAAGSANRDVVLSGDATLSSSMDIFTLGITNNSSGRATILYPENSSSPSVTGSGPTQFLNASTITGTNMTGVNYVWSGYNLIDSRQPIYDLGGSNTRLGAASGKKIAFTDRNVANLVTIDEATGALAASGASNKGSVALVAGSKTVTVTDVTICTCNDTTTIANPCKGTIAAGTLTLTGTGTDTVSYICL